MAMIAFGLFGLLILAGTIGTYIWVGGFGTTLSNQSVDWANFGSYVGGIAGPSLSFLALIAVVWTVRLQYDLLQRDRERQRSDQHIRWLEALYKDIVDVLRTPLSVLSGVGPTSVWTVLENEVDSTTVDPAIFKNRLNELMKLLSQYCEAVALYRRSINEFSDLRIFVDRGSRILDRLKPFQAALGTLSPITIEFCDMHLRGEQSRKTPEALARQTRL
jgi:hypothetical protein